MFPLSTKGGGMAMAFPDVCKTPAPPAPFVPVPYPNIAQVAQSQKTAKKVKVVNKLVVTKKSEVSRSQGDEAGTLKGMISATNMDKMKRSQGISKVKCEGAQVVTVLQMTGHNGSNSNAPPGTQLAPSQTKVIITAF